MAAGLGFKTFTSGEVLTAADVNGYLMQGVGVYTDAANRDAEITSPQEGQFAYLKDTNVTTYYTGSAWANLDTTGMTNPMTTTGDTIYSSSGSTPARLGIGSTGQVLTVSGGLPTWATSSSGGMTLLSTTTLSGATTTISSINQTYTNLQIFVSGVTNATGDGQIRIAPNGTTNITGSQTSNGGSNVDSRVNEYLFLTGASKPSQRTLSENSWAINFFNYASTTSRKAYSVNGQFYDDTYNFVPFFATGMANTNSAISSLVFSNSAGNLSTGTVLIYGVK